MHPKTVTDPSTPRPDRNRIIVAGLVALVGVVWIAQGIGVPIGGGFMVGDTFWAYAGSVLIALAGAYVAWPGLRRRGD